MSLIEQALQKEKARGAAARVATPRPAAQRARETAPQPQAPLLPESALRPLKPARINATDMEQSGVLLHSDDQAAIRAYKILRTQVLRKLEAEGWNSLIVTAVGVGDGKTVTALNLAIALARDVNTRVALIDLDLQRPSVARYLGLDADAGLDSYLAGKAGIDDICYDIGVERLAVIPTLGSVAHASEALRSPAMAALLEEMRRQQRLIVCDLPPLLLGDDVLALAPSVDSVLLVVGEGTTQRAALEAARSVIADLRILGVVLNRSAERDNTKYY